MIGNDKKINSSAGFTLIEILIAVSVFSIAVAAFMGLFTSAFKYQQKAQSAVELLNNISFVTEYMSKALRMAQKDMDGKCIDAKGNFLLLSDSHIKFLNYNGECQEFYLGSGDGQLWTRKLNASQQLTSSRINIESLKFYISGGSQNDQLQPKVTFVFKFKTKEIQPQSITTQTTVSQRQLDVPY